MPMPQTELEAHLREAFPGASIVVEDLAGDGDHYRARNVSKAFRVRRRQLAYAALKGAMGGELHALALDTRTPEEG
jgi:stress-induced morphogen